jgi:hypothetical protein
MLEKLDVACNVNMASLLRGYRMTKNVGFLGECDQNKSIEATSYIVKNRGRLSVLHHSLRAGLGAHAGIAANDLRTTNSLS